LIIPTDFKLNLPNLREITIDEGSAPVFGIGNHLPDDVLTYASLCLSERSVSLPFIAKQRNLVELVLDEFSDVDASQLKLKYLQIKSKFDFKGQDKLKFLYLKGQIDEEDMTAMGTQLKSLEWLKMAYPVSDFSPLRNMKTLKRLKVSMVSMHSLSTLRSNYITKLTIETRNEFAINETSIGQLAHGCPNLIEFTLRSEHAFFLHKQVHLILSLWPRLEIFKCHIDMEEYKYVEGVEHENLKYLELIEDKENEELVKLVANCKTLDGFKIKRLSSTNFLKNVLSSRPSLKSFCAESMTKTVDFVEVLVDFGQSLLCFHSFSTLPNEIMARYLSDQTLVQRYPHTKNDHLGFWLKTNEAIECHCFFFNFEKNNYI
jgi:hypothetical protein